MSNRSIKLHHFSRPRSRLWNIRTRFYYFLFHDISAFVSSRFFPIFHPDVVTGSDRVVFSQESKEEIKEKYINDRGLTNLIPSRKSKLLFYIIKYRNCFELKLRDYQRGIKVLSSPLGRKRHRYLIARTFLIWKLSVEPRVPGWHDAKRLMGPSPSSNIFQCSLPRSLI